jgi:hypothetical protein
MAIAEPEIQRFSKLCPTSSGQTLRAKVALSRRSPRLAFLYRLGVHLWQVVGAVVSGTRTCTKTGRQRSAADILLGDVRRTLMHALPHRAPSPARLHFPASSGGCLRHPARVSQACWQETGCAFLTASGPQIQVLQPGVHVRNAQCVRAPLPAFVLQLSGGRLSLAFLEPVLEKS